MGTKWRLIKRFPFGTDIPLSVDELKDRISASTISNMVKRLDDQLAAFSRRPLQETYPYLILDAGYEKLRENGVVGSRAVMIALGIDWDGRPRCWVWSWPTGRAARPGGNSNIGLRERGLESVKFVVSDDHAGLRAAVPEVLPWAVWQRCYVHFLRNALDHMPRKRDHDCIQELRWLYDRRNLDEARADLAAWLVRWHARYPKLTAWVEENIEETLSHFKLPQQHHKHMKSTNMLERG